MSTFNFDLTQKVINIPPGEYHLENPIELNVKGQVLNGAGRHITKLIIHKGEFNGDHVIHVNSGEPAPQIQNLSIIFDGYGPSEERPTAIYANHQPRLVVRHVAIIKPYNGIYLGNNSGGCYIDDVQISPLNTGIFIGDALDIMRINNLHVWPFGMNDVEQTHFYEYSTGIKTTRVDGLFINNSMFICRLGLYMGELAFGNISNTGFDAYAKIVLNNASLSMSNCYQTVIDHHDARLVLLNNSQLNMSNCRISYDVSLDDGVVYWADIIDSNLIISNSYIDILNNPIFGTLKGGFLATGSYIKARKVYFIKTKGCVINDESIGWWHKLFDGHNYYM